MSVHPPNPAPEPYPQQQPAAYAQQGVPFAGYPAQLLRKNGMATAAMVLGIIAVLFAAFPFIGIFVAAPCGLLAFIFGIVGIVKGKNIQVGTGPAVVGLVLGILAAIMMALGGGTLW